MRMIRAFSLLLLPSLLFSCEKKRPTFIVFAAASTAAVLPRIGALYTEKFSGSKLAAEPSFNFAASSTLARQIDRGAPADLFISAAPIWMDYLAERARLEPHSRRDLLSNRLVIITRSARETPTQTKTPSETETNSSPAPLKDFLYRMPEDDLLARGRWALGDPDHVPAGLYAQAALEKLDWWRRLAPRIVPARDVRAAVRFVARGECEYAIVYASDVHKSGAVRTLALLPQSSHPPIRYPAALLRDASPAAFKFLGFLFSPEATALFREHGFTVIQVDVKRR